jgi:hypothetical protein
MKKLRGEDVQADVDEYLAKEAQKNDEGNRRSSCK